MPSDQNGLFREGLENVLLIGLQGAHQRPNNTRRLKKTVNLFDLVFVMNNMYSILETIQYILVALLIGTIAKK